MSMRGLEVAGLAKLVFLAGLGVGRGEKTGESLLSADGGCLGRTIALKSSNVCPFGGMDERSFWHLDIHSFLKP